MKLYEKLFIIFGIVALLAIISVVIYGAMVITDMGLHVKDYNVKITDKNWPITFERRDGFTKLYNRASGFQDTIYFIAVNGNAKDIEWLGEKIKGTESWNSGSPIENINGSSLRRVG